MSFVISRTIRNSISIPDARDPGDARNLEKGRASLSTDTNPIPQLALRGLDELWFQVGGTLCNLSCHHCFISCNPRNDSFGFLDFETVREHLEASRRHGVKEYYFTGGEPFLNKEMPRILEETLKYGPATVLTNGTVFTRRSVERLADIARASRFSLEFRVSIDGYNAEMNDPIRGSGTFDDALRGVRLLVDAGFLPIITMTQTWPERETGAVFDRFARVLRQHGYPRPRIKILPTIHLGMEETRTRPYHAHARVTSELLEDFDLDQLLCHHSRIVTDRGVAVCPILVEKPDAHLGKTLDEAARPISLNHNACFTCYLYGTICSNTGAASWGKDR